VSCNSPREFTLGSDVYQVGGSNNTTKSSIDRLLPHALGPCDGWRKNQVPGNEAGSTPVPDSHFAVSNILVEPR